jgi:hypothetical protein
MTGGKFQPVFTIIYKVKMFFEKKMEPGFVEDKPISVGKATKNLVLHTFFLTNHTSFHPLSEGNIR